LQRRIGQRNIRPFAAGAVGISVVEPADPAWPHRLFGQAQDSRGIMSSTFEIVAGVISETSEIPLEKITPEVHAIDDLGIDSLDFLDIVFALDKKFGIKIPLEAWTEDVNQGRAKVEDYFVLKNLCARIDELVAAKNA
jgi:acyl carrier protein